MTVTFWCPEAPTYVVTEGSESDPDGLLTYDQSVLPEIQLSNYNAAGIIAKFQLKEFESDCVGQIPVARLDDVIARIRDGVDTALREEAIGQSSPLRSFHDSIYVEGTGQRLLELLSLAKTHSYEVVWA